ncbi:hypothetical protein LIR45_03265 [Lachnospiraceae bacterium EP-SM-12S-S03]|nr:hypothetical protein [Lachnospiraceae bacterium EP-SM-12S-S03]
MGRKKKCKDIIQCMLYERPGLNKRLTCMKKSFDEVFHILNPRCKCGKDV